MGEREQAQSGEMSESADPESSVCTKRKMCIITGDCLLLPSPLEVYVCQPNLVSWNVLLPPLCWGPGDCAETARICPDSEHHLSPFPCMGSHVTEGGDHECIKSGYMALAALVVFSLILTVKEKGPGRKRHLQQVNTWLCRWCDKQGFVFYNHKVLL